MSIDIPINNIPDANDLWKGIGGHFSSLSEILCEFIDNSISNFKANKTISKTILITCKQLKDNQYLVSVEDSGTGIKDINSAFTLGSKKCLESPMNEHGFGMKHALASANVKNDYWKIYTRDRDDFKNNRYKKIEAPYKIENFGAKHVSISEEQWPGMLHSTGTYIEFICNHELFKTIQKGTGKSYGFENNIKVLAEDLGFIYSGVLGKNATITIRYEDIHGNESEIAVEPILPEWEQFIKPYQGKTIIDLGGGNVELLYSFGAMKESKDNFKYYRRNMSSSGLEIRINGRMLDYNLFKEVWEIEKHNKYNYLLITVDIISDNRDALPKTKTSKNGIRKDDEKLDNLIRWVVSHYPKPGANPDDDDSEESLFERLEYIKNSQLPDPKTITREQKVYKNIKENVKIDLYVSMNGKIIIYEGKKLKTTIKDVYQLKMYWDGCVLDGLEPNQAILIAETHPDSVKSLVNYINQMKDLNDNHYQFEIKTWENEGVLTNKY